MIHIYDWSSGASSQSVNGELSPAVDVFDFADFCSFLFDDFLALTTIKKMACVRCNLCVHVVLFP